MLPKEYREKPGNVLLAMEYGRALNLPLAIVLTGVHVIDGRPSLSAGLMHGMIVGAGHRVRITGDMRQATCAIVRKDDPEFTYTATFSVEDAQRAELLKIQPDGSIRSRGASGKATGWEKYPKAMLLARALSACARQACPDVLAGISYVPEELGDDSRPDLGDMVVQNGAAPTPSYAPTAPEQPPAGNPTQETAQANSAPPADEHPPSTDELTPRELDNLRGQLDAAVQALDLDGVAAIARVALEQGLAGVADEARAQWFDVRDQLVQQEQQDAQG
jgi:hypothetical protein